ncbi:MAG: GldG family protein [Clostridia bacterium]|nr:GldG family protein [Clostridia bacterium]
MNSDMTLFKMYLELENYEVKNLDLLTGNGKVPEDCSCLIIASPTKDFAEIEANAIKEYIQKGGNILWLTNPYSGSEESPNTKSILDMYGVNIRQDGIILEQDPSKIVMESPDLIIPETGYSEITENISNVLLFDSGKLDFVDEEKFEELRVTKTDLLISSEKSFFRTNLNLGYSGVSVGNGEKAESSILGALLEKTIKSGDDADTETITSKLVVYANNLFAQDYGVQVGSSYLSAIGFYNNRDLALNSAQYLAEVEDSITIRKEVESTSYTATETQNRIIKIIIFSVPVIIIIAGIAIWQLRRRKK